MRCTFMILHWFQGSMGQMRVSYISLCGVSWMEQPAFCWRISRARRLFYSSVITRGRPLLILLVWREVRELQKWWMQQLWVYITRRELCSFFEHLLLCYDILHRTYQERTMNTQVGWVRHNHSVNIRLTATWALLLHKTWGIIHMYRGWNFEAVLVFFVCRPEEKVKEIKVSWTGAIA